MNRDPLRSVDPRPVKEQAREQLQSEVEKWLAAGNQIEVVPSYCDDPDQFVFGAVVGERK